MSVVVTRVRESFGNLVGMVKILMVTLVAGFATASTSKVQASLEVSTSTKVDPEFLSFLTKLKRAVAAKDANFIKSIVDSEIRSSFGAESGKTYFLKQFSDLSKPSKFWTEMRKVLALGANQTGSTVCIPSIVCDGSWPDVYDPIEFKLVTRGGTQVFAKPSTRSRKLTLLSQTIVRAKYHDEKWSIVELPRAQSAPGARSGYVRKSSLYSLMDSRAYFEKKKDGWRMTSFISGD